MTTQSRTETEQKKLADRIENIIQAVAIYRRPMVDIWPWPDEISCLYYAQTEMGEFIDAWLRIVRDGDVRNNGRNHRPEQELAQVAVMVASALAWTMSHHTALNSVSKAMATEWPMMTPATLNYYIANALNYCQAERNENRNRPGLTWKRYSMIALWTIALWPDMNIEWEIQTYLTANYHRRVRDARMETAEMNKLWNAIRPGIDRLDTKQIADLVKYEQTT